jgi:hypothetical protein
VNLKQGVRVQGLRPEILLAAIVADGVYRDLDARDAVITSCVDGSHSPGSKHYVGAAIDLRIWTLEEAKHKTAVRMLKERLTDDYDVVLEHDHIHVEYDPKKPL